MNKYITMDPPGLGWINLFSKGENYEQQSPFCYTKARFPLAKYD